MLESRGWASNSPNGTSGVGKVRGCEEEVSLFSEWGDHLKDRVHYGMLDQRSRFRLSWSWFVSVLSIYRVGQKSKREILSILYLRQILTNFQFFSPVHSVENCNKMVTKYTKNAAYFLGLCGRSTVDLSASATKFLAKHTQAHNVSVGIRYVHARGIGITYDHQRAIIRIGPLSISALGHNTSARTVGMVYDKKGEASLMLRHRLNRRIRSESVKYSISLLSSIREEWDATSRAVPDMF